REKRDNRIRRREAAKAQPLARKIDGQGFRPWIGEHAPYLPFENNRIFEFALARQIRKFVIGGRAPQEKRQSRSEFEIADAVWLIGGKTGRLGFDPVNELWMRQNSLQRKLDSMVEPSFLTGRLIQRH